MMKSKVRWIFLLFGLLLAKVVFFPSNIVLANSACPPLVFDGMDENFIARIDYGWQDFTISGFGSPDTFPNGTISKISCKNLNTGNQSDITNNIFIDSNRQIVRVGEGSGFGMSCWNSPGTWQISVEYTGENIVCPIKEYRVQPASSAYQCSNVKLVSFTGPNSESGITNSCFESLDRVTYFADVTNTITRDISTFNNGTITSALTAPQFNVFVDRNSQVPNGGLLFSGQLNFLFTKIAPYYSASPNIDVEITDLIERGNYEPNDVLTVSLFLNDERTSIPGCTKSIKKLPPGECTPEYIFEYERESSEPFNLCAQIPGSADDQTNPTTPKGACIACVNKNGIWTALGCIETDGTSIITSFVKIALGMAGGIGMLMIIAAGAMFTLSRNDPTKVGNAKELLTSVIVGLLFIIFSVTILQFIGVTILQIPGFGGA